MCTCAISVLSLRLLQGKELAVYAKDSLKFFRFTGQEDLNK